MKKTSSVLELLAKFSNKYGQAQPAQRAYSISEEGGKELGTIMGIVSNDPKVWDDVAQQAAGKFYHAPGAANRIAGTHSGLFSVQTPQGEKKFYLE
jgi:hypothetical protein